MAKPTTSYDFNANGLSVKFTDNSAGVITSRLWNFGFNTAGNPTTSTDQNPEITFPAPGSYIVSLACTNADGTDTYTRQLLLSVTPGLNITIKEMVLAELPTGISLDMVVFSQNIRKWQLMLYEGLKISESDIFDETKWPALANVLISKLLVYELILAAASASMTAFLTATKSFNENSTKVTSGTMLVADYEVEFDQAILSTGTVTINLLEANGLQKGPSTTLNSPSAFLAWLNSQGIGLFIFEGTKLKSLANTNVLTTFNFTHSVNGGTNGAFTQTNQRVIPINTSVQVTAQIGGNAKGPLKRVETGPSNVEWYDGSSYWTQMFKGSGSSFSSSSSSGTSATGSNGVIAAIQSEACIYASKLKIFLPWCPQPKNVTLFQIGKKC